MISATDYVKHDAVGLAALVRDREVSAGDLAEAALGLIEKHNPALNAVTERMDEFARGAVADGLPQGPFAGVPTLLKDLFQNLPGVPCNNGSALFKGWLPPYESTLLAANTAADLIELTGAFGRPLGTNDLERWTFTLASLAEGKTAGEVMLGHRNLWRMHRPMGAFLARHDVLLTPTLGSPPVRLGVMDPGLEDQDELMRRVFAFIPFTPLANAFGHPAASVPLYWNAEGLPVGVMLQARLGADDVLLRLAAQLEAARPWADRHPPIWG
jgi:Asp-tRNA(Asn)/Glu-tRNA(Gln) amidotransferase A subunit family amidase